MSNTTGRVTYALFSSSTFLKINSSSGQLTLEEQIGLQHNNSKFNITATLDNDVARTEIIILVLLSQHGDQFALEAVRAVRRKMQNEEATGTPTIFIPAILNILLQQVAEGSPRTDISKTEEIVESAIRLVKVAVIQPYGML